MADGMLISLNREETLKQQNLVLQNRIKLLEQEISIAAEYKDKHQSELLVRFCALLNEKKRKIDHLGRQLHEVEQSATREIEAVNESVTEASSNPTRKRKPSSRKVSSTTSSSRENDQAPIPNPEGGTIT